jgi:heat shock protein HtpX
MSDATGFITSQKNNRRASVVILAGTFLLLFVVVNALVFVVGGFTSQKCEPVRSASGALTGQEACTNNFQVQPVVVGVVGVLVVGYLVFAWLASGRAALTMVHARPAEGPEFAEVRSLVEQMSIASGLPVPQVYVVDDPAPNAFATGRNPNHAAITVTTGLLQILSRRELRGVLAHEMAHIANRDIAVTTLAVLAVGAIAVIGDIALRVGIFSGGGRNRDSNGAGMMLLLSLAIYLIAIPAAFLLKAALSRKRESLADASAVEFTREPGGIRSALEKLEADTTVISHPSAATAHLWIESPLDRESGHGVRGGFGRLFDTHPPLSERIAFLRGLEGLDPEARGPNDPPPTGAAPSAPSAPTAPTSPPSAPPPPAPA